MCGYLSFLPACVPVCPSISICHISLNHTLQRARLRFIPLHRRHGTPKLPSHLLSLLFNHQSPPAPPYASLKCTQETKHFKFNDLNEFAKIKLIHGCLYDQTAQVLRDLGKSLWQCVPVTNCKMPLIENLLYDPI